MIKAQWGIAIDITGEVISFNKYQNKNLCKKINDYIWIRFLFSIDYKEENLIKYGLLRIAESINFASPYKNDTLIIFHTIDYNPCDYQLEGLIPAVYKWISNTFMINTPEYSVKFNGKLNKYEFYYGDTNKNK